MIEELEAFRRRGNRLLRSLYEATGGDGERTVSPEALAARHGFSEEEAQRLVGYLYGEGLVACHDEGQVSITPEGSARIERGFGLAEL